MSLLDTKFAGQAVGVGKAPILGRIHLAQLKIGGTFFNCSITVIDQDGMEFIFGLDMLRRHQVRPAFVSVSSFLASPVFSLFCISLLGV